MYREPKGVAAVISPRNYPSTLLIREIIPTLLAGNTVMYKPASACMRTAKLICDMLISVLPQDVCIPVYANAVVGQALVELPTDLTIFT